MSLDSQPNPFDNAQQQFLVLSNHLQHLSLWPQNINIPAGWQRIFGPDKRASCIEFVQTQYV